MDGQGRLAGVVHILDASAIVAVLLLVPMVSHGIRLVAGRGHPEIHQVKPEVVWSAQTPMRISGKRFDAWCQVYVGEQAAHRVRCLNQGLLDVTLPRDLLPGVHDVRLIDRIGRMTVKRRALTMLESPPDPSAMPYEPAHLALPVDPAPPSAPRPAPRSQRTLPWKPANVGISPRYVPPHPSMKVISILLDMSMDEVERLARFAEPGADPIPGVRSLRVARVGYLDPRRQDQLKNANAFFYTAWSRPPCRTSRRDLESHQWVLLELELDASGLSASRGTGAVRHVRPLAAGVPFQLMLPGIDVAGVVVTEPLVTFQLADRHE
jgi:hypothetical protein